MKDNIEWFQLRQRARLVSQVELDDFKTGSMQSCEAPLFQVGAGCR
jgi:hypothetical protein